MYQQNIIVSYISECVYKLLHAYGILWYRDNTSDF